MGKTSKSIEKAQDAVLFQFQKDIRSEQKRTWLTAVEQAIEDGKRAKEYRERQKAKEQVFISFHNPDSPLRGSASWTKQQWSEYREKVKADKRAAALAAKNK